MSHEIQTKKLWKPLQKIGVGSLKAIFARALHEDLRGLRKPSSIIAQVLGCHENTARNYLAGETEPSTTHSARLAQDSRFRTFRSVLAEAFSPSDTSLQEAVENHRILTARLEQRLREELSHVRPDLPLDGMASTSLAEGPSRRGAVAPARSRTSSAKG